MSIALSRVVRARLHGGRIRTPQPRKHFPSQPFSADHDARTGRGTRGRCMPLFAAPGSTHPRPLRARTRRHMLARVPSAGRLVAEQAGQAHADDAHAAPRAAPQRSPNARSARADLRPQQAESEVSQRRARCVASFFRSKPPKNNEALFAVGGRDAPTALRRAHAERAQLSCPARAHGRLARAAPQRARRSLLSVAPARTQPRQGPAEHAKPGLGLAHGQTHLRCGLGRPLGTGAGRGLAPRRASWVADRC